MQQQYSFFNEPKKNIGSINELSESLQNYLSDKHIDLAKRAYYYAEQAHDGQIRRSGEPYVTHPLAVAGILAEMHMDHQSIMAAMLHDVIEDTDITKQDLTSQFGDTVADLVDGVSKLTQIEFRSKAEAQAENFQKMALAMAKDIRVILVKLADRLHNMRTLGVMRPEKRRRVAKETLDIYAPIAQRLGMHRLRVELEDLCFEMSYPMRAERIRSGVKQARGNRKAIVEQIKESIELTLEQESHQARVVGREKHLYSIYEKMRGKRKSFSEIMDIFGFRIVVNSVDSCYRVLGCIHSLYRPVPGTFKDYIAIPKSNGYQSLHTVLIGPHGVPIELQIRTEEMDEMANHGIAAHWLYKSENKEKLNASHSRAREWVRELLEMQERAGSSIEFIENVKIDLFPAEVYVFTPKGKILTLPRGSTPVDFAYAVHTDIGNKCVACRINRKVASLSEPIQNGQTIQIITAKSGHPKPSWLNFVVTGKARTNIRHYLKTQQRGDAIKLGGRLLDEALEGLDSNLEQITEQQKSEFLSATGLSSFDKVLEEIGTANRVSSLAAHQLLTNESHQGSVNSDQVLTITGTEGFKLNFAHCCYPIPGDAIAGYISAERGIVVHTQSCYNMVELANNPERMMPLKWSSGVAGEFDVALLLKVQKSRGVIAVIANAINALGANIDRIETVESDPGISEVRLVIAVESRDQLARIMLDVKHIPEVFRVSRVRH